MNSLNVKILVAGVVLAGAFMGGYKVADWRWEAKHNTFIAELEKAKAENTNLVLATERLNTELANTVQRKLKLEESLLLKKEKVIYKEVIKYEQTNSNSTCELDSEWVQIINAATPMPNIAGTAARINGTIRTVSDFSQALEIITHNYNVCSKAVLKLQAWKDFYSSLQQAPTIVSESLPE